MIPWNIPINSFRITIKLEHSNKFGREETLEHSKQQDGIPDNVSRGNH